MNWTETRERLLARDIPADRLPQEWEWGIDLTEADLTDADLRGANLRGACLTDADLTGANLRGACLTDADLTGANLRGACLTDADLTGANLRGADLRGTHLTDADLRGTYLTDADLRGAFLPTTVKVEGLDKEILDILLSGAGELEMNTWHTCDTTHCRAGWAIVLAGPAGRVLEDIYGPAVAGALIYAASYPRLPVPDFYASNEAALEDIRARAELTGEPERIDQ